MNGPSEVQRRLHELAGRGAGGIQRAICGARERSPRSVVGGEWRFYCELPAGHAETYLARAPGETEAQARAAQAEHAASIDGAGAVRWKG